MRKFIFWFTLLVGAAALITATLAMMQSEALASPISPTPVPAEIGTDNQVRYVVLAMILVLACLVTAVWAWRSSRRD